MKLLVVDDDERIRRMIKIIVSDISESIYECSDGSQANESYAKYRPDWVLMDIEMEEKDGITATREILADFPKARVVIVTAHENAALREAAQNAGARGYILKENLLDLPALLIAA